MKTNLLLAFGTTLLCLLAGMAALRYILPASPVAEGASFESIDDLRTQIQVRDERDVKSDKSVSFRSIVQPHPSDLVIYELQPNLDVKFQRVRVTTNSLGMRGKEISLEKPADVVRIALLGDSYAFGWGVEQDKIFAAQLETMLGEAAPEGKRVEVLNFGVPGYSTFQQVNQFLEKGPALEPDLVLVFFVDNDFGLPFFIKTLDGSADLTSSSNFQRMKKKATTANQQRRAGALVESIDPNRHLARLASTMAEKHVPVVVSINPRRSMSADERRLPVLRDQANLIYAPIKEGYLQKVAERGLTRAQLTLPNDPHPSAMRHGIYAELLREKLVPVLWPTQ